MSDGLDGTVPLWHGSCVEHDAFSSPRSPPMSEKSILIVLHQEHSTPGRVGRLLAERGYRLDVKRPPLGCMLPECLDEHAGVVVFGGPMSANDEHDWLRRQTDWIGAVLRHGTPFLGLCLGAQILARHLGAAVKPHPQGCAEIGYYPVRPTASGRALADQLGVAWPEQVYHWHREGFDLPAGAEPLMEGDLFPNQAFRVGHNAYGFQFHPEVTYAMMCRWTVRAHERMALPGARTRAEHLDGWFQHDPAVRRFLDGFLDHWLDSGSVPVRPSERVRHGAEMGVGALRPVPEPIGA
jgi:GMP synthase (glutamine-hydrolysing)